jgi:short-subunit dehydrogenase
MELSGTRVLLTGAGPGLGAAMAQAFTAAGSRVALLHGGDDAVIELAERLGGTAHVVDLAEQGAVDGLVARVESTDGPIDVLVNNAALAGSMLADEADEVEIQRTVALNLTTPQRLCRQVLPGMIARERGHIVNVSSLAGVVNLPGGATYGATMAGLSHFTGGLRVDLKGAPVSVTLVEAGPVDGDDGGGGPGAVRSLPVRAAVRRLGRLGLLTEAAPGAVAEQVLRAVQADRYHVRQPRRALAAYVVADLPRRAVTGLLAGVRARP